MLGIIGAMDEEVAEIKNQMTEVTVERAAAMDFYKGKLRGKDVVVVRSGIGKVNAAVCTQILADRYGVDAVVNTGIAGSLRNEINIGTLSWPQTRCSTTWTPPALITRRERFPRWMCMNLRRTRDCAPWRRSAAAR